MAKYAAEGAGVTLVTCTLGEFGEIIPADLADLSWEREDRLGEHRIGELAAACAALGVSDHRFLGGAGRWHDSGMMGTPPNDADGSFWRADVDEAARALLEVIMDVRPAVLVTYDANGFYGHPDHIQAHRVAWRAFELADGVVRKFYVTTMPKSVLAEGIKVMKESGAGGSDAGFLAVDSVDDLPFGVPDEQVTTMIDARDYLQAKLAALRAHRSQIAVDSPFFALSDLVGQRAFGQEYYMLIAGPRGPGSGPARWEDDLFAGLD